MKLVQNLYAWKSVEYFGHNLIVPNWTKYLACDECGALYAHKIKPSVGYEGCGNGVWLFGEEIIAIFSLNETDWKDTLVEVG